MQLIDVVAPNNMALVDRVMFLSSLGAVRHEKSFPKMKSGTRLVRMEVPDDVNAYQAMPLQKELTGAKVLVSSSDPIRFIDTVIGLAKKGAIRCLASNPNKNSVTLILPNPNVEDEGPNARIIQGEFDIKGNEVEDETQKEEVVVQDESKPEITTQVQETVSATSNEDKEPDESEQQTVYTESFLKTLNHAALSEICEELNIEVKRSKADCRKAILEYQDGR